MQEQQVTIDLETLPLPRPFMIIATQNPVELAGTFPLPEAQLDRFLLRVGLNYPTAEEEGLILSRFDGANPLDTLGSVIEAREIIEMQKLCRQVYVDDSIRDYTLAITRATRSAPSSISRAILHIRYRSSTAMTSSWAAIWNTESAEV